MSDIEDSLQVYLNSKFASQTQQNGAITQFNLPYINASNGHYIYISVINASIPFSFYNINKTNNIVVIKVKKASLPPIYYTMTMTLGNYNANQFVKYFNITTNWVSSDPLNPDIGITCSYDSITNKFTYVMVWDAINMQNFQFCTTYGSTQNPAGVYTTANAILGLSLPNQYLDDFSQDGKYISINSINLATIRQVNIMTNFTSGNLTVLSKNNYNTLCSIPVLVLPNSLIAYQNPNQFKTNLYISEFNSITIILTDQDGNLLNFNGQDFNLTLQLDIVKFT